VLRSVFVAAKSWAPVVFALATLACHEPAFPRSSEHPLLGRKVPEIGPQTTVFGDAFDPDELRGHPVFVKFFAEYCVPCKEGLPTFQKLHKKYPDVRFIGIDEDKQAEAGVELALSFGLTFPVLADEGKDLSDRFQVSTLPTSFAADASGVVRWVGTSRQRDQDLKAAVAAIR
jgi:thiol-disulfide isomerase/thioredoxin